MKKRLYLLFFAIMICFTFLSAAAVSQEVKASKQSIEEIFKKAKERLPELEVKIEEKKRLARIEAKSRHIAELNAEAETLMARGDFKKAKAIYEKILNLSAEQIKDSYRCL